MKRYRSWTGKTVLKTAPTIKLPAGPHVGDIDLAVGIAIIKEMIGYIWFGQSRWITQIPFPGGNSGNPHPDLAIIADVEGLYLSLIKGALTTGLRQGLVIFPDIPIGQLGGGEFA